jgi:copper chaperone CopZ
MTCNSCAKSIKEELLKIKYITKAIVDITDSQAVITMSEEIPLDILQSALIKAGNYTIMRTGVDDISYNKHNTKSWIKTYKPILVIGAYIVIVTTLIEVNRNKFEIENCMANFMSGFFLVFSFFKLLDLKGFADAYSTYDIFAKRWYNWGYIYAFIEFVLGIAYMLKSHLLVIDIITFLVMIFSLVGVLQSVLNKKKIRCACLGTVFNLPMGTVTIIEDLLMICMSALMVILKILRF